MVYGEAYFTNETPCLAAMARIASYSVSCLFMLIVDEIYPGCQICHDTRVPAGNCASLVRTCSSVSADDASNENSTELVGDVSPYGIKIDGNDVSHMPYGTRPTTRSLGPGSLILCTLVNPAAFIQAVYSGSL